MPNIIKKKFLRNCPNCKQNDKVIMRCVSCFRLTCNICSINQMCIDCYLEKTESMNIDSYFDEKYLDKRIIKVTA